MTVPVIGVVGGTGSGKTTAARMLATSVSGIALSQDFYYRPVNHLSGSELARYNFDCPHAIDFDLMRRDLARLRAGKPAKIPVYSYATHAREGFRRVDPACCVVVEGTMLLSDEGVGDLIDASLFVDAPERTRLARRIARDASSREIAEEETRRNFFDCVQPMHDRFVEPQRAEVDYLIRNEGSLGNLKAGITSFLERLKADSDFCECRDCAGGTGVRHVDEI